MSTCAPVQGMPFESHPLRQNPRLFDGDFLSPCAPIQGMEFASQPLRQNPRHFDRDFFLSPCKEFLLAGHRQARSSAARSNKHNSFAANKKSFAIGRQRTFTFFFSKSASMQVYCAGRESSSTYRQQSLPGQSVHRLPARGQKTALPARAGCPCRKYRPCRRKRQ